MLYLSKSISCKVHGNWVRAIWWSSTQSLSITQTWADLDMAHLYFFSQKNGALSSCFDENAMLGHQDYITSRYLSNSFKSNTDKSNSSASPMAALYLCVESSRTLAWGSPHQNTTTTTNGLLGSITRGKWSKWSKTIHWLSPPTVKTDTEMHKCKGVGCE